MLVWQGLGIFGFIIPAIAYLLSEYLAEKFLGSGYSYRHAWPNALALLLSAIPVWLLGKRLASSGVASVVDPATGPAVPIQRKHTLLSMDLRTIALILVGMAAFDMFAPRSWH